MRRFGIGLLAVALFSGLSPVPRAEAHVGACVLQGTMQLSDGFANLLNGPLNGGYVGISGAVGGCANSSNLLETFSSFGWITGWCDLAYGYGTTSTGHDFSFTIGPNRIVFSGEVVGELNFVLDPTHSGTCIGGTATRFLVSGAVVIADDVPSTTPPMETLCNETTFC